MTILLLRPIFFMVVLYNINWPKGWLSYFNQFLIRFPHIAFLTHFNFLISLETLICPLKANSWCPLILSVHKRDPSGSFLFCTDVFIEVTWVPPSFMKVCLLEFMRLVTEVLEFSFNNAQVNGVSMGLRWAVPWVKY